MTENLKGDLEKDRRKRFLWGAVLAWIPTIPLPVLFALESVLTEE